jgi:hypothetical protein
VDGVAHGAGFLVTALTERIAGGDIMQQELAGTELVWQPQAELRRPVWLAEEMGQWASKAGPF